jgi:hypothetical protein
LFVATTTALFVAVAGSGTLQQAAVAQSAAVAQPAAVHIPVWAKALGAGVTVFPPATTSPGHGSPAAAVEGEVAAFNAKQPTKACPYIEPSFEATCRRAFTKTPASEIPMVEDFAIGYAAVDGKKALVGSTGTFCVPGEKPRCVTNNNPAALFSSGKSFKALWAEANAAADSSANVYSLAPCEEVGGDWYDYVGSSS